MNFKEIKLREKSSEFHKFLIKKKQYFSFYERLQLQ